MSEQIGRRELMGVAAAVAGAAVAVGGSAAAQEASAKRKIVGISCSPRKGMTTAAGLTVCLEAAKEHDAGVETELIEVADLSIPAQLAAGQPLKEGETDDFPMIAEKLSDPAVAGIVVGSPVYFGNMSALCKAFLDRCIVLRKSGFKLAGKVAGALAVGGTRNGGQELTVQSIHTGLMGQNVIITGTAQPSVRIGATLWNQENSIEGDEFGLGTARDLGKRIAELTRAGEDV